MVLQEVKIKCKDKRYAKKYTDVMLKTKKAFILTFMPGKNMIISTEVNKLEKGLITKTGNGPVTKYVN